MNVPLLLTMIRVAAIPLVVVLLYPHDTAMHHVAAVLFAMAAVTDWLDGWLARRWHQTTDFGAFLDPVADKLLVAVCLVMLLRLHASGPLSVLVGIIIGREIAISALREWLAELGQRYRVAVNFIGKTKTAAQMTAITLMLWQTPIAGIPVYQIGYALLFFAAGMTLWSMMVYLRAAWPVMRRSV